MRSRSLILIVLILNAVITNGQDDRRLPFMDTSLSFETRVNDLVKRMTLEEKVGQMLNAAPAIERLGIPAYDWWNEALHGVARTPYHVTSFPQAIAMAATWDTSSIKLMGRYTATEGRAIFNDEKKKGQPGNRYAGLTYWTPNINIFRDPRWGRGQETYGEDPYLTSMMAGSFVRGLQGNDPKYLAAAACAKHFAVHSGPEATRHSDNVTPSTYDLWDTYLPAFRELVVHAKVAGVMCAYNAVNTQPCCANDLLMNNILREKWKFTGYVTSDCWAVDDFFRYHKTHKDAISSAVDAVIHGTDLECGNFVYRTLIAAVKSGLVKEAVIDQSVKRLFLIRFRLGMFDPENIVPFSFVGLSELNSPAHNALALKIARQSVVLLRNEGHTLPLPKNIRRIAVLGPNANDPVPMLGNYNGTPEHVTTILEGIREKLGKSGNVFYEQVTGYTTDTVFHEKELPGKFSTEGRSGIKVEYFSNDRFEGKPLSANFDTTWRHYWNEGESPAEGINGLHFFARFSGIFRSSIDSILQMRIVGDDGYRLFINDSLVVDGWSGHRGLPMHFPWLVQKDSSYRLVLEYFQSEGPGYIHLQAGKYARTDINTLKEELKDVDAIIFAGGISPQLEGEEMPVAVPGFKGGDRTSIRLPAIQTEWLHLLKETGKPVIFVMQTGSALAIPWESENIPAILNAWYGGEAGGKAVADVLFGDYNPAGRLPVTFYRSDDDLPSFSNYDMQGRTYRYFEGRPLYAFGYGLSYTTFRYDQLNIQQVVPKKRNVPCSVRITNTGNMDGEEVAELYVSFPSANVHHPVRTLKGFRRIYLKQGESKVLHFNLSPDDLSLVNEKGEAWQPGGKVLISIGGSQPGSAQPPSSKVVSKTLTIR